MMPDLHLAEQVAKDRLREARERAARYQLTRGTVSMPVRVQVGLALIRIGRWLSEQTPGAPGDVDRARAAA